MTDSTQPDAPQADATDARWSPELDALVAAPAHHTLLIEDKQVRVLNTTIAPAIAPPIHTHRWPTAQYILSWSAFVRFDAEGVRCRAAVGFTPGPRIGDAIASAVGGAVAATRARKCGRGRSACDQCRGQGCV